MPLFMLATGVAADAVAAPVEDMKTASNLREQAQRSNREMRRARARGGDHAAEHMHKREAIAHEREMKTRG